MNQKTTQKIKPFCPDCYSEFDIHVDVDGKLTSFNENDISLCCCCGCVSKFQSNGMLIPLTAGDHINLISTDFIHYKSIFATSFAIRAASRPGVNMSAQFN